MQFVIQPQILHGLVTLARSARLGPFKFEKIVLVGISFGAGVVSSALAAYPEDADGLILQSRGTNVSLSLGFVGNTIANQNDPEEYGGLANGYLGTLTMTSRQARFSLTRRVQSTAPRSRFRF